MHPYVLHEESRPLSLSPLSLSPSLSPLSLLPSLSRSVSLPCLCLSRPSLSPSRSLSNNQLLSGLCLHFEAKWWSFKGLLYGQSFAAALASMPCPRSGELRMQKLKSHVVRTQSLNFLSLKPGVGQYIAVHATHTAMDFFLPYFYPSGLFACIFFKTSPDFPCAGCG